MWSAQFTNVDKSGLQPEMKVTVEFSNDVDDTTYTRDYTIMPADFPGGLDKVIQQQVEILNAKDAITDEAVTATVGKAIELKPMPVEEIIK